MSNVYQDIASGLSVASQLPLDAKRYFNTIAQMKDLGTGNNKAYTYYEYMSVINVETGLKYVWKDVGSGFTGGILDNNFQYPNGVIINDIDYSNRFFNFVIDETQLPALNIARPWLIFKYNNSPNNYLEVNDCVMGYDGDALVTKRYKGGIVTEAASWAPINSINPLTYD